MAIFVTSSGFINGRIGWRSAGSKAVCSPAWPAAPSKPRYDAMFWAISLLEQSHEHDHYSTERCMPSTLMTEGQKCIFSRFDFEVL